MSARIQTRLAFVVSTAVCLTLLHSEEGAADPGEPLGAEDYRAEKREIIIPEPMVFDLVRGLGAKRGELEANVLVRVPVRDSDSRELMWAPEIEWALADDLALEFELPFEGDELEAFKFAGQYTFGAVSRRGFIHGGQLIVEKREGVNLWEVSPLYVPGARFNETFSALALVGIRVVSGSDFESASEALVNVTGFADVGERTTLGLELNYASGLRSAPGSALIMPQIHLEASDHFVLQAGAGVLLVDSDSYPEISSRFVYTF